MHLTWSDPPYVADPNDTGLQFTDIMFGFALSEVVTRLAKWNVLTSACRVHLMLTALIIIGSYFGFRNSLKRGKFPLRFFNLATFRFLVDQVMVFLYFWLALYISTDVDPKTGNVKLPSAHALLRFDSRVLVAIFTLYLVWDLMSHWMQATRKYVVSRTVPEIGGYVVVPSATSSTARLEGEFRLTAATPSAGEKADQLLEAPRFRTVITGAAAVISGVSLCLVSSNKPNGGAATCWLGGLIGLVVLYRVAKDVVRP